MIQTTKSSQPVWMVLIPQTPKWTPSSSWKRFKLLVLSVDKSRSSIDLVVGFFELRGLRPPTVGFGLRVLLGIVVRVLVGLLVVARVGIGTEANVGSLVGTLVGTSMGISVGATVGAMDGSSEASAGISE